MIPVLDNLHTVRDRIAKACCLSGRQTSDVSLLAVSKGHSPSKLSTLIAAGHSVFAENYIQEALQKMAALESHQLEWHFIGSLQSNKTRLVAEHFSWVHSIDRLKLAQRLSSQRPHTLPPLQVCVQVNLDDEQSKSGCSPQETQALCAAISHLPRLCLRGLMTLPEATQDKTLQRKRFKHLHLLLDNIRQTGIALDTLSMGMSNDFEAAILEGATMVRVGTAIFGARGAI